MKNKLLFYKYFNKIFILTLNNFIFIKILN